ncbi:MAG: hypothetical protein JWN73_4415 [Betaproteobacteria bacterium]|nr:hypothetical protein [Betaproteobacteria bacterium]
MNILKLFGLTVASMLFGGASLVPAKAVYTLGGSSRYGRS